MRKIIALIILIGLIGALYYNQDKLMSKKPNTSYDIDKILDVDIESQYPTTPREVVIFYNNTIECLYKVGLNDNKSQLLLELQRNLFAKELLDNNPFDIHFLRVKSDIEEYKKNNKIIIDSKTQELVPDDYYKVNGQEICKVKSIYYLNTNNNNIYQEFILKKDVDNKWKIFGWRKTKQFTIIGD